MAFHFRGYIWFRHPYKKVALSLSLSREMYSSPHDSANQFQLQPQGFIIMFPLHITESLHLFQKAVEQKNYVHHFEKLASKKQYQKIGNITINKSFLLNPSGQVLIFHQPRFPPIRYLLKVPKKLVRCFFCQTRTAKRPVHLPAAVAAPGPEI